MKIRSLIVGGGIAGVTVALCLWKKKEEFLLLESSPRLGGKVETKRISGGLLEMGPSSFLAEPPMILEMIEALGMKDSLLSPAPEAKQRFILKRGRISRLPSNPFELFTTDSLSWNGKFRFLRELFYASPRQQGEESVFDFFLRHFGRETAQSFADPFVSGIFAGDSSQLSLDAAFPTMREAEIKSGSLLRHLIRKKKTGGPPSSLYQIRGGLGSIFAEASSKMGEENFHRNEAVQSIVRLPRGFQVLTNKATYETEKLYLAVPAYEAARLFQNQTPSLADLLRQVQYAPLVTAHLRIRRNEKNRLSGFGLLIPTAEKRQILGILWNSSSFPSLFTDKQHHYVTVYAGGARNRQIVEEERDRLVQKILDETSSVLSLHETIDLLELRRHTAAIPQYNLGYNRILEAISQELRTLQSLKLVGNYLGGVSLPRTVAHAISQVL
ncbi:MAG: protoporphyrinogen oxidase [Deltaproteobacteria bacterium]|nr:protoporphyrinogen oxidase [Deltaproteobacteria bacterium]